MRNRATRSQAQRIKALIANVGAATALDLELQAHWARYICVLCSGLLEVGISEIYSDYVQGQASPGVAAFAKANLASIQNPKMQRFVDVATRFRADWGHDLEAFAALNGRKDAIDSIIANRHLIAHGKDSGITLARISDYLDKAIEVLEFIEGQCTA